MTADQIQQCKDKLLLIHKKHQELEVAFAEDDYQGIPEQNNEGRLSLMESMESQKAILKESRDREMLSEKIEGGLRRIATGNFGNCFYCEQAIGFKRLEANPTHTLCLKCATTDVKGVREDDVE